jgi:Ricin-type beta-trefoil lectin domain
MSYPSKLLFVLKKACIARKQMQITVRFTLIASFTVAGLPTAHSQAVPPHTTNGTIYNEFSNMCLEPESSSKDPGTAIVQQPCNGTTAQQWTAIKQIVKGENVVHYQNQLSGMCLDARGAAANKTPVQQWPCSNISNQNWTYGAYASLQGPLIAVVQSDINTTQRTGYCLDMPLQLATPGLHMQIYACNQTLAQRWLTPLP